MPRPPPKSMCWMAMPPPRPPAPGPACDPWRPGRASFGDLRADVAVDADHAQAGQRRRAGRWHGALVGDAELVALQAGGDVGVGLGVHVGVDADADRCAQAHGLGDFAEHLQLGLALDVEAANAGLQRLAHLGAGLAHAGEDLRRVAAGGHHAFSSPPDDVDVAAAGARNSRKHGQRSWPSWRSRSAPAPGKAAAGRLASAPSMAACE